MPANRRIAENVLMALCNVAAADQVIQSLSQTGIETVVGLSCEV